MIFSRPVETYAELAQQFPGINELEPRALGKFAFHAARHFPSEAFMYQETGEPYEGWHADISEVLRDVESWRGGRIGHEGTRIELAQRVARKATRQYETGQLLESLGTASATEGYALVTDFLERGGYKVQTTMVPSPLFPDGRVAYEPIENYGDPRNKRDTFSLPYHATIVDGDGSPVAEEIKEYMRNGHQHKLTYEKTQDALAGLEMVDENEFEKLRAEYGAKAAGLICFSEKVHELSAQLKNVSFTVDLRVPPFVPVSASLYDAWLNDDPSYVEDIERIRQQAINFERDVYGNSAGMVAVRSSAVESEDGQEHTGAGVYASMAVDPRDKDAFMQAVASVYASTTSEAALSYQQNIGITNERMGLVIQRYQEANAGTHRDEFFYGHANSTGSNPNIIDLHTSEGTLLYDKNAVRARLMIDDGRHESSSELLHTNPDRNTQLRQVVHKADAVPHAVVLAEQIFGKPMQVEFANNAIVQVRPLILAETEARVTFPDHLEAVGDCAAAGVGDLELQPLDELADNSEEVGYIVFGNEYGFTINNSGFDYHSFPKEGAVIIMSPSESGHIQAICREKGLMCFYPKKGTDLDGLVDRLFHDDVQPPKLRFVADGYDGKIYEVRDLSS